MSKVNINDRIAVFRVRANMSMALEAFAMAVWSEAKQNHTFKNHTFELEKSIRIDREDLPEKVIYRIMAGIGFSGGVSPVGGITWGSKRAGAGGSNKAYYALYVELGTRRNAAYPYLRPALFNKQQEFLPTIRQMMKNMFNR